MSKRDRSKEPKEVRSANLVATIRTNLPQVGFVKIATGGRKASFIFRGLEYLASSRLTVREVGLCGQTHETDETERLQNRLRRANTVA